MDTEAVVVVLSEGAATPTVSYHRAETRQRSGQKQ